MSIISNSFTIPHDSHQILACSLKVAPAKWHSHCHATMWSSLEVWTQSHTIPAFHSAHQTKQQTAASYCVTNAVCVSYQTSPAGRRSAGSLQETSQEHSQTRRRVPDISHRPDQGLHNGTDTHRQTHCLWVRQLTPSFLSTAYVPSLISSELLTFYWSSYQV